MRSESGALRVLVLLSFLSLPAGAQVCEDFAGGINVGFDGLLDTIPMEANCACTDNCTEGFRCYEPELVGPSYETRPAGCNPKVQSCTVRATVPVKFPGLSQGLGTPGSGAIMDWTNAASVPVGRCGHLGHDILVDQGNAWIEITGFSCASGASLAGAYDMRAQVCAGACPKQATEEVDLSVPTLDAIFCKKPPAHGCPGKAPAGACCLGPGGGSSPGGGGGGTGGDGTGPGAHLYYLAGGVGHPDHPGATLWKPNLGRYWSHTYAERIVLDPNDFHVWLITMYGTYVEFSGLSGGAYTVTRPTDEYRRLHRIAAGWELRDLDGTVQHFDAAGRWSRTVDRNGNARVADYSSGPLTRVTLPDGRREDSSTIRTASSRRSGKSGSTARPGGAGCTPGVGTISSASPVPTGPLWSFCTVMPASPVT